MNNFAAIEVMKKHKVDYEVSFFYLYGTGIHCIRLIFICYRLLLVSLLNWKLIRVLVANQVLHNYSLNATKS